MIILGLSITPEVLHTQEPRFCWDHWNFLVYKECKIRFKLNIWREPVWDFTYFIKLFALVST